VLGVADSRGSTQVWLFGPRADAAVFGGPAILSVAMFLLSGQLAPGGETPLWAWLILVLGVDVAHVWSTGFRVYFDGEELRERLALYIGVPVVVWAVGVAAYAQSPLWFWRFFAYAAAYHFVRQQYGWIALYGRREGAGVWERRLDALTVYAATVGPLVYWHSAPARPFAWFVEGDFLLHLPTWTGAASLVISAAVLLGFNCVQLAKALRGQTVQRGKALLVASTAVTWVGGIVVAENDFQFTVMNVIAHGVPYFVLTFRYASAKADEGKTSWAQRIVRWGPIAFAVVVLVLAFGEELLWDRLVWHERSEVFGAPWALPPSALTLLVPLLALPQGVHYVLDAFIWRPSGQPELRRRLGLAPAVNPYRSAV
jgi:hypothetical protein